MDYFDYESVAREARLTPEQLSRVIERVGREYPADPMLRELHVLRACRAIRDGVMTLDQFPLRAGLPHAVALIASVPEPASLSLMAMPG